MASLAVSSDCQAGVWSCRRAVLAVPLVATVATPWDAERCVSLESARRGKAGYPVPSGQCPADGQSNRTSLILENLPVPGRGYAGQELLPQTRRWIQKGK